MGCGACGTSSGTNHPGCRSNGNCASGCDKLTSYDWLSHVPVPEGMTPYNMVEVRFKNGRKGFFSNFQKMPLQGGDAIVVEASPGYDLGMVTLIGEMARIQARIKAPTMREAEARKVLRKATPEDLEKWKQARGKEAETRKKAREIIGRLQLDMKLSDVEYQGDGTKATFYYIADGRVDFRELIKELSSAFRIRVQMKQIGSRQEAGRIGGIGTCGRELCCSSWLTDFRSVSTSAARYQQLALNPQKLAGQCGKLKCCLNYELDMYVDAMKEFPKANSLQTAAGRAVHIKTEVFRKVMWFAYDDKSEGGPGMFPLSLEAVREIVELNKQGKKPEGLNEFKEVEEEAEPDYTNVVGQDDLDRFKHVFKKKKRRKGSSGGGRGRGGQAQASDKSSGGGQQGKTQQGQSKGTSKRRKPRPKKDASATPDKAPQATKAGSPSKGGRGRSGRRRKGGGGQGGQKKENQ